MAGSRKPGPLGLDGVPDLDDGTLARTPSPRPGVGGSDDDATSRLAWAQFRVSPRLADDATGVAVVGSSFRLIRADQLDYFRDDELYEVVPQHEARRLLQLMGATQAIAATERATLQEAIPLLAD